MAENASKLLSGIAKRTKGAYKAAKKKVAKSGPQVRGNRLPECRGAKAKFSSYKIDKFDDGTPYINLTFIGLVDPIKGRRANVSFKFADTERKTAGQVVDDFINDVTLIGGDFSECESEQDWADVLNTLVKDKPVAKLDVWNWEFNGKSGQKVSISGTAEEGDDDEGTTDDEGENDTDDSSDDDDSGDSDDADDSDGDSDDDSDDSDDSDDGDGDEGDSDDADGDSDDNADDDEFVPEKGATYGYKPPKTKKVLAFKILAVNTKAKTVKGKAGGKTYEKVKFDDLTDAPNAE